MLAKSLHGQLLDNIPERVVVADIGQPVEKDVSAIGRRRAYRLN